MAQIDDTIATYLTAIEVEGKTQNTVLSYRASLEDFRRVGRRLGFSGELKWLQEPRRPRPGSSLIRLRRQPGAGSWLIRSGAR